MSRPPKDAKLAPLAAVLRWPTPAIRTWTAEFLRAARLDEGIRAVVAIGSAVRPGVASEDLDLLLMWSGPERPRPRPPVGVDLVAIPAERVYEQIEQGRDVLVWAVRYGRLLLDRDGFWGGVLSAWQARLPWPAWQVSAERADAALALVRGVLQAGDYDAAREQAVFYFTHLGRAELLRSHVFPASRPELAEQLRSIGAHRLARSLDAMMDPESDQAAALAELARADDPLAPADPAPASPR